MKNTRIVKTLAIASLSALSLIAGPFKLQEPAMKNTRIVKTLAIASISVLSLIAGASQANDWGHYERANAPYFPDRTDFDHRGPNAFQHLESGYNIDARQQQQMEQIMQGLRSGELSRHEGHDLIREQKEIEQMQRHYLADGRISRDEWLQLDRRLDQAARDIHAEKHDRNWR